MGRGRQKWRYKERLDEDKSTISERIETLRKKNYDESHCEFSSYASNITWNVLLNQVQRQCRNEVDFHNPAVCIFYTYVACAWNIFTAFVHKSIKYT